MSYGRDGKKGGEGFDADIKNIEVHYEIEDAKQDNTKNTTSSNENSSQHELVELIKKAEQGNANAQFLLARKYVLGDGVKQDFEQAKFWLEKAAKQGHKKAVEGLENLEQLVLLEGMKKSLGVLNSEKSQTKPIPTTQPEKDDYVELNSKIFKTEDEREAQATENAYTFEQKIIELANQISSSNQYSYQDMELVEGNTMVADEIVYMRAWQGKGYFFIRNYENKSWSKNQLTHFYLNDKSNVNFSGRIKIGCTLDDLTAVFGDKLEWSGSDRPSEWTLTTRANWIMNFYISSKGYVHEIQYTTVGSITSKMSLLYAFNSGELFAADVSGQKVNVRDYPDASGTNVVFQANKSKKDVLLVIDKANSHANGVYNNISDEWYRVIGRISRNKFISVEGEAYVIYKYINIRPMTNVERNIVSSALN